MESSELGRQLLPAFTLKLGPWPRLSWVPGPPGTHPGTYRLRPARAHSLQRTSPGCVLLI